MNPFARIPGLGDTLATDTADTVDMEEEYERRVWALEDAATILDGLYVGSSVSDLVRVAQYIETGLFTPDDDEHDVLHEGSAPDFGFDNGSIPEEKIADLGDPGRVLSTPPTNVVGEHHYADLDGDRLVFEPSGVFPDRVLVTARSERSEWVEPQEVQVLIPFADLRRILGL